MFLTVFKTTHHLPNLSSPDTTALFKYSHQNFYTFLLCTTSFDEKNIDF